MKNSSLKLMFLFLSFSIIGCSTDTPNFIRSNSDNTAELNHSGSDTPSSAFDEFSSNVEITFSDNTITLETDGTPNHTSPYWSETNSLHIEPVVAAESQMSPGTIASGNYSLTVSASPGLAENSSSTGLGAIGIATSGVPIFNDEEGPNVALSATVASGFDYAGGHMGPTGYHYHLESQDVDANTTLSHDDEDLVGIMEDGFLLYGRRCNSVSEGDTYGYPTNLDASGGHTHKTQHSSTDDEDFYHYHIVNEIYTGNYYVLFGGDLQGAPQGI